MGVMGELLIKDVVVVENVKCLVTATKCKWHQILPGA